MPDATNPPNPGTPSAPSGDRRRHSFASDFRRFFIGGLKALLPTLITLWLLFWVWNFLWENIGRHVIWAIQWLWVTLQDADLLPDKWYFPAGEIRRRLYIGGGNREPDFAVKLLGVGLAILVVYIVGVFVGNLIGRTMWRLAERLVMRLPLVRAIYPSVKQVTDFLLADRSAQSGAFPGSRVVAVQARHQGVWSIGLVTGTGGPMNGAIRGDLITVFIPSSPTAVAGYVVVAHRDQVVDLPLTVEEALRLLVSGGVLVPAAGDKGPQALPAADGSAATAPVALAPAAAPVATGGDAPRPVESTTVR